MGRIHHIRMLIIVLMFAAPACTDKDLDIEIEQDACKRFKIETPAYTPIEDPCSGGTRYRAEIQFDFRRTADCLNQVNNYPKFYRSDNQEISPLSFNATVDRSLVTINDNSATYIFQAEFADQAAASQLNHIILDFDTQDEVGSKSNELQIRLNTSCSTVDPASYDVNNNEVDIPRSQNFFTIRLWDNAAEDGDIVSVYLNGQWIIENHTLLKAGTDFNFSTSFLNPGANDLVVFALNEGSSGPNTVSIAINGEEIPNFSPGLLTGEAVRINF
jgi:hypothetical protein